MSLVGSKGLDALLVCNGLLLLGRLLLASRDSIPMARGF